MDSQTFSKQNKKSKTIQFVDYDGILTRLNYTNALNSNGGRRANVLADYLFKFVALWKKGNQNNVKHHGANITSKFKSNYMKTTDGSVDRTQIDKIYIMLVLVLADELNFIAIPEYSLWTVPIRCKDGQSESWTEQKLSWS